ncbi:hypothetical protein FHETE_7775 [Fusarium heterosporum]|uniref:Uncharacterized protein n=1 Tax=Fusarium heterosporum TaxID=42747 RepID=A0A8H5T510_FUSHE|nr:hypothetical protein FHETE_7775 [Fusarium heterosporum]
MQVQDDPTRPCLPFGKLPRELQAEIVSYTILPLILPCTGRNRNSRVTSAGEQSLLSLKLSCRGIYEALRYLRPVEAIGRESRARDIPLFSFDPKNDILRVWDMSLPRAETSGIKTEADFPARRLISMSDTPLAQRTEIRWKVNRTLYPATPRKFDALDRSIPNPTAENFPYIGLYGYEGSLDTKGGYWPGFKYFDATGEVWFTPLTWHEVCHVTMVPLAGDDGEETLYEDHHAQFIARIWIVRDSQTGPPDEARWKRVKKWEPGMPGWVCAVEMIWLAICQKVERQRWGRVSYKLRV